MNFNRYNKGLAESPNNVLLNNLIVEGDMIQYFNVKADVKIDKIDNEKGIVIFKQQIHNEVYRWWDYFMDANCFVLNKL